MPRPRSRKQVKLLPSPRVLVPLHEVEEVVLGLEELEALRLADMEGMYHEEAAREMKVSRATFGRLVEVARKKVAIALVEGWAIRVTAGNAEIAQVAKDEPREAPL